MDPDPTSERDAARTTGVRLFIGAVVLMFVVFAIAVATFESILVLAIGAPVMVAVGLTLRNLLVGPR